MRLHTNRNLLSMMSVAQRLLFTLVLIFSSWRTAAAEDSLPLRQFDHQAWSLRDGAPSDINAITQTKDGYLWFGTANGLFRFDGAHFERYVPPNNQQLLSRSIQSLFATPDGGLWIGYTLGYTSFLKNGTVQNYSQLIWNRGGTVWSFALDKDGSMWAATYRGPIHFFAGAWHGVSADEGYDQNASSAVSIDETGAVWFVTDEFLYRRPPGSKLFHRTKIDTGGDGMVEQGPNGRLLICEQTGVLVVDERDPETTERNYLTKVQGLYDVLFDSSGGLWIATFKNGISRIERPDLTASSSSGASVEHFTAADGLTSTRMRAMFKDREGSIWIAASDGLRRFRPTVLKPAALPSSFGLFAVTAGPGSSLYVGTEQEGLQLYQEGSSTRVAGVKAEKITSIYQASDGKLWLGGVDHLQYIERGKVVDVPLPPELQDHSDIQAMTVDQDGDLWLQTLANPSIFRLHGKEWTAVPRIERASQQTLVMMTDHKGRVWAGYLKGLLGIYSKMQTIMLHPRDGVTVGNVTALYDSGDAVWVGGERGLEAFIHDRPVQVNFVGTEQIAGVSGILRGSDGSLWLNSLNGIVQIAPEEIQHFLSDARYAVRYSLYNNLDGLSGQAPQLRPFPSLVQGNDGRIWATTTVGVVSLDPQRIFKNALAPPVDIASIKGDGSVFVPSRNLTLPKGTRDIEIDYAALSLAIPERVRFKYRLEGFDRDWQEADQRRAAFYTHLPPGHYVFHVIACNNDGVWNATGATASFYLAPKFYQTLWFKSLLALLLAGLIVLAVALRLRFMASQLREQWRVRVSERERIARELHDTFFQSLQGMLLRIGTATRKVEPDTEARRELDQALGQSAEVMATGRHLVQNLRSTSRPQSLIEELESVGREFQGLYPTTFKTSVQGHIRELNPTVEEELYKIGREAISNAFHHAKASEIRAELKYDTSGIRLLVRDNGVGIEDSVLIAGKRTGHWGLPGIRERADTLRGTFQIHSVPKEGTTIEISVRARKAYRSSGLRLRQWMGFPWREFRDG